MPDKMLVYHIPLAVEEVYAVFSDMQRFAAINPVIYKCDSLSDGGYRIYERINMGINISFSYKATMMPGEQNKRVSMHAVIMPGVHLRLVFDFEAQGAHTKMTESITFDGPGLVKPWFLKFLAKNHMNMVAALHGKQ